MVGGRGRTVHQASTARATGTAVLSTFPSICPRDTGSGGASVILAHTTNPNKVEDRAQLTQTPKYDYTMCSLSLAF